MSRNIFWDEVKQGDILYLAEPLAYRENHDKNKPYAPMLPEYVVVDNDDAYEKGVIHLAGFPYKKGAINLFDNDADFFSHVGNIDDAGFDINDVREEPYVFSNYYKIGGHLRSDNKTVLYLDSLLSGMHNFNFRKKGNNEELFNLFEKFNKKGKLLPTEMAYIINRLIKGLHQTAIVYHDGDTDQAMETVIKTLFEKSRKMDTLPK